MFIARALQPGRNGGKLPLLLSIADDGICDGTAKTVGNNRRRAINLLVGWFLFLLKPDKNIRIGHFLDDLANLFKLRFQDRRADMRDGNFPFSMA